MPWGKKNSGGKVCVYKKTTGEILHCYSGKSADARADRYLAALYMHAPASEKKEFDALYGKTHGGMIIRKQV